jgi:hypothetical protein
LLKNGRTTHSYFRFPVDGEANITCNVSKKSALGKFKKKVKVVIIDEAPMIQKSHLDAIHNMFHELDGTSNDPELKHIPFGGRLLILSGDFR